MPARLSQGKLTFGSRSLIAGSWFVLTETRSERTLPSALVNDPRPNLTVRARVADAVGRLLRVLDVWAVLITLGLLPTAAALLAALVGILSKDPLLPLSIALALSVIANLALVTAALHFRNYSRALVNDMELIGEMMRERATAQRPVSWLPIDPDTLPFSDGDLDAMHESALAEARKRLGSDAQVGLRWIGLSIGTASFQAFSLGAHKTASLLAYANGPPELFNIKRADQPPERTHSRPWRSDTTWRPLLLQSWRAEEPFAGQLILWPSPPYGRARPPYLWTVQYMPITEGVFGPSRHYIWNDASSLRVE